MNFICATVLLKDVQPEPIEALAFLIAPLMLLYPTAAGTQRCDLSSSAMTEKVQSLMLLNHGSQENAGLGQLVFAEDFKGPLQVIINTIETNVPRDMYLNQVVLGNAFFKDGEIAVRKNNVIACKVGTTLDESDTKSFMFMELHESRKQKLEQRIRAGRGLCISGFLREWHKEENDSPYRAIVANDFSTRKETEKKKRATGSAAGYSEVDPTPDY